MQMLGIPLIVAIVYGLVELLKVTFKNAKFSTFLPLISGVLGVGLGIFAFYVSPEVIFASSVLEAVLLGLVSGLTATGSNQIIKQMKELMNISKSVKEDIPSNEESTAESQKEDKGADDNS